MGKISIIICSRNKEIPEELYLNLKKTTGCDFELINIDNSLNRYTIFEAYNIGIRRATTPILVFLHDDVILITEDWGLKLIEIFESNPDVGLVGVAGSKIKTKIPSAWWENNEEFLVMNIIQHNVQSSQKITHIKGFFDSSLEEVAIIDGVFMALRKEEGLFFDESMSGFHNYDLNLSLEVIKRGRKIAVTNQILLEHYSAGKINGEWIKSNLKLTKIYKNHLPIQSKGSRITRRDKEMNYLFFIENCRFMGFKKIAFQYWLKYFLFKPFSSKNIFWVKYFLKI